VYVGHNHLGPFLRAAALRQHHDSTVTTRATPAEQKTRLAADWAWPEDIANPLSHLTLLTSLDLSANQLTHVGCDVMASLRGLSRLALADNLVARLDDVSLRCVGPRLTHLDVSTNRLTQLTVQSLSSLSGLQQLDARANPLLCDNDAACAARRKFRRWLNDTVRRLTLLRHPDDALDQYVCQDLGVSYVSGPLDCDEAPLTVTAEQSTAYHARRKHTTIMLVSILSDLHAGQYLDYDAGQYLV